MTDELVKQAKANLLMEYDDAKAHLYQLVETARSRSAVFLRIGKTMAGYEAALHMLGSVFVGLCATRLNDDDVRLANSADAMALDREIHEAVEALTQLEVRKRNLRVA